MTLVDRLMLATSVWSEPALPKIVEHPSPGAVCLGTFDPPYLLKAGKRYVPVFRGGGSEMWEVDEAGCPVVEARRASPSMTVPAS